MMNLRDFFIVVNIEPCWRGSLVMIASPRYQ
jgi:hypothetical protein